MQDPFLEDLRREMSEESDDSGKAGASEVQEAKHVRNITDLQPQEMARLEERFRPGGVDSGMGIEEFEKTMEEFTGMEVSLGQQLFCKIDANDDGGIEWDEFLTYIVHDAGVKLDQAKSQQTCSIEIGDMPKDMFQSKDMVSCSVLCTRQRIVASFALVRPNLCFWSLDTLSKAGEALIPSASELQGGAAKVVAGRSLAYHATAEGALFVSSGTTQVILVYDCRKFRLAHKIAHVAVPSSLAVVRDPDAPATRPADSAAWLLVGDVEGAVSVLDASTFVLVGRYSAHSPGLAGGNTGGSLVSSVALWPDLGLISAGEDGRIVVGDHRRAHAPRAPRVLMPRAGAR